MREGDWERESVLLMSGKKERKAEANSSGPFSGSIPFLCTHQPHGASFIQTRCCTATMSTVPGDWVSGGRALTWSR